MPIDVDTLLALPAADRLVLAEVLRSSVGYPPDVDAPALPAWQRARLDRLLARYASDTFGD